MHEIQTAGILDFGSLERFFQRVLPDSLDRFAFFIAAFTLAFIVINVMVQTTAVYTWFERRVLARFQARPQPLGAVRHASANRRPDKADD